MACISRSVISVAGNTGNTNSFSLNTHQFSRKFGGIYTSKFRIRASSDEADDCNVEECAPDKEVGKVSVEWLADEKTRVVGTFPPRKKGWTGYIEKDTAGQTNIYSVEPTVYVAETAISSGTAGSSSDGAENTLGVAVFAGIIFVAGVSSILLQVGKSAPPQTPTTVYSGPSLAYYINKFTPTEIIEAPAPTQTETSSVTTGENESSSATAQIESSSITSTETQDSTPDVQQVQVESGAVLEPSASNADSSS